MTLHLNQRAHQLAETTAKSAELLRIEIQKLPGGGRVFDFGVEAAGGTEAGITLSRLCMADLGTVSIGAGDVDGRHWPTVEVRTDHPLAACLLSQYAGWRISVEKFFAMGSGPMRSAAAVEDLFEKFEYREMPTHIIGILEASSLPDSKVVEYIAEKAGVDPSHTLLCVAPTASQAGALQVVARSVETALHKLLEIGFDVTRVASAWGTAPLPPPSADDLAGIGRTNDAILYGGCVTLWVRGDDESLEAIGPRVPACASESHGRPFLEIFESAGRDFYAIDPHLFSPAQVTFQNLDSGRVHHFGRLAPEVLRKSFGL